MEGPAFQAAGSRDPYHVVLTEPNGKEQWWGAKPQFYHTRGGSTPFLLQPAHGGSGSFALNRDCKSEGYPHPTATCVEQDDLQMCIVESCRPRPEENAHCKTPTIPSAHTEL